MKRHTSIKTRITIWYTALMFVLISVVFGAVSLLSYQLSMDNLEKDIKFRVSQVSNRVGVRQSKDMFYTVDSKRDFRNVSVYLENGEHIAGQYLYDLSNISFKHDVLRRETVDGKTYIVYDIFKPARPGDNSGYWIRGAESVSYTNILGRSVFVILLFVIPIILLLTALGGYYITKKAFMPVNSITKTANDIYTLNDLEQRIELAPNAHKDELYNLSVTLNRMLDKIESLIKQEKQFTSDASHELRTPISVILAQGEYLLEIADTDKERELAEAIVEKSNQISRLVSRLLLLARIDASRQKVNKEKIDLGVLIDIAADELKDSAEKKDITIITNAEDNIIIEADEALLLSAISNLISNAIKYGKESGQVIVASKKQGNCAEITVSDNGIGISQENMAKIWDRFYRVDDVRNNEDASSGLGLSLVKSIAELLGGEVFVQSELGKGTEFKIVLYNI